MLKILSIFVVIALFFITIQPIETGFSSRVPSNSLDGYWTSYGATGCMENDALMVFDNDTIYARLDPENGILPWAKINNLHYEEETLVLEYTILKSKRNVISWLRDEGDNLYRTHTKFKDVNDSEFKIDRKWRQNGEAFLKTCYVRSIVGDILHNFGLLKYTTKNMIDNLIE